MSLNPSTNSSVDVNTAKDVRVQKGSMEMVPINGADTELKNANITAESQDKEQKVVNIALQTTDSGKASESIPTENEVSPEMVSVVVFPDKLPLRLGTKIWLKCIHKQFPVKRVSGNYDEAILTVEEINSGCSIQGGIVGGKLHGKAFIFKEDNSIWAIVNYVNGKVDGECELYDRRGRLFFAGIANDGYIYRGNIYDEKLKLWREINTEGYIVTIAHYQFFFRDGVCYDYNNGVIEEVSVWSKESKLFCHKKFNKKTMTEFNEYGIKVYEGGFNNSISSHYSKERDGKLYDSGGQQVIYNGQFWKDKRFGYGTSYNNGDVTYDGFWYFNHSSRFWKYFILIYSCIMIVVSIILYLLQGYITSLLIVCLLVVSLISILVYRVYLLNNIPCKPKVDRRTDIGVGIKIPFINPFTTELVILDNSCNSRKKFYAGKYKFLKSFTVGEKSFQNVRELELKNMEYLERINLKEGSYTSIKEGAAKNAQTKFTVENCEKLSSINVQSVIISNLPHLKTLSIGNNSFQSTKSLTIKNLSMLDSISIGESCFQSSSLYMSNLPVLLSIRIGRYSFKNGDICEINSIMILSSITIMEYCFQYAKKFRVVNLPFLQTIIVGEKCFQSASFEINNVPKLQKIHFQDSSFHNSNEFILESLKSLSSLVIGDDCFQSASFGISNLPLLKDLHIGSNSFKNSELFRIESLDSLESIIIGDHCFKSASLFMDTLPVLLNLSIGVDCFSSSFEVRNLTKLKSIHINNNSFKNGELFKIESLNSLESIIIEDNCFQSAKVMINSNSLRTIRIGRNCFLSSSFEVTGIPSLKEIHIGNDSFKNSKLFKIESLDSLESIIIGDHCFKFRKI